MARPATCFYWKSRQAYATDAGGTRRILVRGPKSKANKELALQRLGEFLGTRLSRPIVSANVTVAELVDRFLDHEPLLVVM